LYGEAPAAEFSPLKLKAVRQRMIDAGLCRGVSNQRVGRIVRMFKWAVAEEKKPVTTYQALKTVKGLERGRTEARETEPVRARSTMLTWMPCCPTSRRLLGQ
jgi:hypothetical protein